MTITQGRVQEDVSRLLKEVWEYDDLRGKDRQVTPKPGVLVRKSPWAPDWLKEQVTIEGEFYPPLPRSIIPGRTIFSPDPLLLKGAMRYLELKGYGREGQGFYLHNHSVGSVYWGMYLEEAQNEFDRLLLATKAGLPVVLPLAVVEIPRDQYVKLALEGFAQTVVIRLSFTHRGAAAWLIELIGQGIIDSLYVLKNAEAKAIQQVVEWVEQHPEGIEQGIRAFIGRVDDASHSDSFENKIAHSADALLSAKRFGYLIRAPKSPLRMGDPLDPYVLNDENREMARSMGRTFRRLLEMGFLHHCPGTGNWTSAGELTDFADTFDVRKERVALEAHMREVKYPDMGSFMRYLIGEPHTGKFCPFFVEGVCGRSGVSVDEAAQELLSLIP